jgi:hypothetical protein
MPILKREDGIQFAIHAYRELLQPAKISIMRSEIRMLAQNHGDYVRLFKLPSGQIEAAFSRDPGFLLGEAIWQYFGKPSDLIYCEALSEINYAILVVVRGGSVYLDVKIPFADINDELASVVTGDNQYAVYIYGDVPISDTKQVGKFVIPPAQVASFTRLEKPLFPFLPITEDLQLQPIEFALRSGVLTRAINWRLLGIGAIVFFILLGIYYWATRPTPAKPEVNTPIVRHAPADPYQAYKAALRAPAPEKQLAEVAAVMNAVYVLPGWQVSSVTFATGHYTIPVSSMGGSISGLDQWARNHGMHLSLTAQSAILSTNSHLSPRATPQNIYTLQPLLYYIIDRMDQILPQHSVSLGASAAVANYKTIALTITLSGIAPNVLTLIGRQLANLPVKITKVQVTPGTGGLLSGTIELTILGN